MVNELLNEIGRTVESLRDKLHPDDRKEIDGVYEEILNIHRGRESFRAATPAIILARDVDTLADCYYRGNDVEGLLQGLSGQLHQFSMNVR